MNVIYIHTHDSGRYIEPYGCGIKTPNLMAFARESLLFRHCYNAGPTCSPSRAALLTGMSPHECGMEGLAHRGWKLRDYARHLAPFLGRNGFHTALCGVQHEAPDPAMIGYDELLSPPENDAANPKSRDLVNAHACAEYIARYFSTTGQRPLFLAFGMTSTHRIYPALDPDDTGFDYVTPPPVVYDCEQNRRDIAEFQKSADIADQSVGVVLDALKRAGVYDDSLIIFTTDHGLAFPHMKCTLYDTGIGVSLIVRHPKGARNGRATDALVSHIDLYPTICDAAGIAPPDGLRGTSLIPLLRGESDAAGSEIFSEVTFHAAYEPMRCIRTKRYKLIRFFDSHNGSVLANTDDGYAKRFLLEHGGFSGVRAREMLIDLYIDPLERENLAWDARYKEVYADMWDRLDAWMKDTHDPLLTSGARAPRPQGSRVNSRGCIHPGDNDFEDN